MTDLNGLNRDTLRAELGQLELRLIKSLASKEEVLRLTEKIDDGVARVLALEVKNTTDVAIDKNRKSAFTRREKMMGLALTATVIISNFVPHIAH